MNQGGGQAETGDQLLMYQGGGKQKQGTNY